MPADARGAVADSAFGLLALTTELKGEALALIRPEQISMIEGHVAGSGNLPGRVVELSYPGHETLVTVRPERALGPAGPETILVRVPGPVAPHPGPRSRSAPPADR
ncbi:MAG TPA: TOBE domain-containing protein [Streptosporangiaceae bacterium]|jgi:hypothetical protein